MDTDTIFDKFVKWFLVTLSFLFLILVLLLIFTLIIGIMSMTGHFDLHSV